MTTIFGRSAAMPYQSTKAPATPARFGAATPSDQAVEKGKAFLQRYLSDNGGGDAPPIIAKSKNTLVHFAPDGDGYFQIHFTSPKNDGPQGVRMELGPDLKVIEAERVGGSHIEQLSGERQKRAFQKALTVLSNPKARANRPTPEEEARLNAVVQSPEVPESVAAQFTSPPSPTNAPMSPFVITVTPTPLEYHGWHEGLGS